jgi:adenylate cyclase
MQARPLYRLRPTLLTAIIGLVLLTALAIAAAAAILTRNSTRALVNQVRSAAVAAASEKLGDLFEAAPRITDELARAAERGALPLADRHQLVAALAERLRVQPPLAWIGYGDLNGLYIGAARWVPGGEIVEYIADADIDGGMPQQTAVAADGARTTPVYVETKPYLVVERPWFQAGLKQREPVWSDFYQMTSGGLGVTCTTRFTAPGATAPTGLFHVDLRIESITAFLTSLQIGDHGAVFLYDDKGARIASPTGEHVAAAARAADAATKNRSPTQDDQPFDVAVDGGLYEVVLEPVSITGDIRLQVAVVVNKADITDRIYHQALVAGGVAGLAGLLAIVLAVLLSSRISRPITAIATDLGKVGAFSISHDPSPQSFVREVSELGASVDRMKASLRSFAHYVPTDLVRTLLAVGQEAHLGGEIRRLTIHFSDVADFTSISEGMEPTRLVEATGRYFELMTGVLTRHGGTIDKFMGDGIMAFFNAPVALPDHPRQACLAALEAQRLLAEMARDTPPGEPIFRARIGLGLGDVLVGNIGTPDRFAYTLLGDEVNLSSRLEGLNKIYGTRIMATDAVMDEAGNGFEWRRLDRVAVKGRHQGTLVCELIGLRGEVAANILEARDVYERALDAYFAGEFKRAAELFDTAARLRLDDVGAPTMRERARDLAVQPPAEWNGIHVMHEK